MVDTANEDSLGDLFDSLLLVARMAIDNESRQGT
jgi:hypothetical protein